MSQYALSLLGAYHLGIDQKPVISLPLNRAGALLAYLALESNAAHGQIQPRARLASLFWPEIADTHALHNLRNTLYDLRRLLKKETKRDESTLVETTRHTIRLHAAILVDAVRFQELLADVSTHKHEHLSGCIECEQQLVEAISLYHGELLAGLSLADAPAFEEWLLLRRELLHQRALWATGCLVEIYEERGDVSEAHRFVLKLLEMDSYREESHRSLMRILAWQGSPEQALSHFEKLRQLLQEELSAEPSSETSALAQQIAAGEFPQETKRQDPILPAQPGASTDLSLPSHGASRVEEVSTNEPVSHSTQISLGEVPDPGTFFGRVQERQQLSQWLLQERCRVVAILGMGGQGKTSLAAQGVREIACVLGQAPFDRILWRSLLNAPPLTELLPPLLQVLSAQQLSDVPDDLDAQLRLFLDCFRRQRVLLVLDNLESILKPEQAGAYRPGYEAYGQLIQQIATFEHGSHLLLTSRERPRGYRQLESGSLQVQCLHLEGLDDEAVHELLAQQGLQGVGQETSMLIERYSGNPLALKLMADAVDELFGGNIAEFLAEESLVFDDVRTILDQQFARLSPLEQEILFWLAVEREEMPAPRLRQNFAQQPAQRDFLEALRNLQRRSLVERHAGGFALQNVITEYLTDRLVDEACREIITGSLDRLHRQALLKAQAKEYVRQSQARLLLRPVADQLVARLGNQRLKATVQQLLDQLRREMPGVPSYAGGNLLNLLVQLQDNIAEYDFSHLPVWQAHLRGTTLSGANLAGADLAHSTFTQSFGQVPSTAISPDNRLLASGVETGDITIWNLSDYQPLMILTGHSNSVSEVVFSPDGQQLASSSIDSTIRLWDLQTGQPIWIIEREPSLLFSVAFRPDGRLLASGGGEPFVSLWDSQSGNLLCQLETHSDGPIREVAFHPDGTIVAAAGVGGAIFLWDIASVYGSERSADHASATPKRTMIPAAGQEGYIAIAFSYDGTLFASGDDRGVIKLWNVQTRQEVRTLSGHRVSVRSLEFSPDDRSLVSGSFDQTVRVWDVQSGQCEALFAHNGAVWSVTFSPDGKRLVSAGEDSIIRIWRFESARQTELVKMIQGYRCIIPAAVFSPSDPCLATGNTLGTIRLWDMSRDEPHHTHTLQGHDRVETLAYSPDGRYLASAGGLRDHAIRLWDMTTKQCVAVLPGHTLRVIALSFTPDGTQLASAGKDLTIRMWDIRDPKRCHTLYVLHEHQSTVYNLSFTRDGSQFVSSCQDSTIRLWNTKTGSQLHCIAGLGGNEIVAFSPSEDILACSAGTGGEIRLLDVSNLGAEKTLRMLVGHAHEPVSISYSPDGKQLVSSSSDHSVRLWDVERGEEIYVLDKHRAYVIFVGFSPSGQHFISSSIDGIAYLWDAGTGECIHTFHAPRPYDGMRIAGVTGISEAQRAALKALGAVESFA